MADPNYPHAFRGPPTYDGRVAPEIAGISYAKNGTYRGWQHDDGLQVFSKWQDIRQVSIDPDLPPRFAPLPETPAFKAVRLISPEAKAKACIWHIDVRGYELSRIVPEGVTVGPAGPGEIPTAMQFTRLRARISWGKASGGSVREVDIAEGIRMCVEANMVTVDIMVPVTGTTIAVKGSNFEQREGQIIRSPVPRYTNCMVIDSMVGAQVLESPDSIYPGRDATLTDVVRIPISPGVADPLTGIITSTAPLVPTVGVSVIEVPSGCLGVSIYQDQSGQPAEMQWVSVGDPVYAPSLGDIYLGPTRRAERISRPAGAEAIMVTNPDPTGERVLTFVWHLEI